MSAVFGERLVFPQDAGPPVQLLVWGDEFYARRETTTGYTVVYDTTLGLYCYAQLAQGRFVTTGVPIVKPPPSGIPPHLHEYPAVRQDRASIRIRALDPVAAAAPGVDAVLGTADGLLPGRRVDRGQIKGLTVLIQFPDQQSTVTTTEVEALLNQSGYALDGNRSSVRDFWLEMSNGKLDYRNDVVGPLTLSKPMSSYFVPENTPAPAAKILDEALNLLQQKGIDFPAYDSRGEGVLDALSFMYAGLTIYQMPFWPHNSVHSRMLPDGVRTNYYTITSMGRSRVDLSIGTFCHEAGHLLCRFPDLYDYGTRDGDLEKSSGLGRYCVMSSGNHLGSGREPAGLSAYLRDLVGWPDEVVSLNGPGEFEAVHGDYRRILRYSTPRPNEYFLVENRTRLGADAQLPDTGLAVLHCDTVGSNEFQQGTAAKHYQCALLQADGHLDLEHGVNVGDDGDFYPAVNGVALSDTTTPSSRRWDGSGSGLMISDVSEPGPTIRFRLGNPAPGGQITASSTTVLLIPDDKPEGVTSSLDLSGSGTIRSLQITADIIHTYAGDLTITLYAPNGRQAVLRDRDGGAADDVHGSWTDQTTAGLADLVGAPYAGRWTLRAIDNAKQDTGRLDRWSISVVPDVPAPLSVAASLPDDGLAIPDADAAGITSAVSVDVDAVVAGVRVAVDIEHPFIGDLVVDLTAPSGQVATLHNRTGGGGDNLNLSYDASNAPALAGLAGLAARGEWTLRARDLASLDTGRLRGWSLHLTT